VSEQYQRVANQPIPSPPADVDNDEDPRMWQCPLCSCVVELVSPAKPPERCPACGQEPYREPPADPSDWGAKE
jgi:rubrerythrin